MRSVYLLLHIKPRSHNQHFLVQENLVKVFFCANFVNYGGWFVPYRHFNDNLCLIAFVFGPRNNDKTTRNDEIFRPTIYRLLARNLSSFHHEITRYNLSLFVNSERRQKGAIFSFRYFGARRRNNEKKCIFSSPPRNNDYLRLFVISGQKDEKTNRGKIAFLTSPRNNDKLLGLKTKYFAALISALSISLYRGYLLTAKRKKKTKKETKRKKNEKKTARKVTKRK